MWPWMQPSISLTPRTVCLQVELFRLQNCTAMPVMLWWTNLEVRTTQCPATNPWEKKQLFLCVYGERCASPAFRAETVFSAGNTSKRLCNPSSSSSGASPCSVIQCFSGLLHFLIILVLMFLWTLQLLYPLKGKVGCGAGRNIRTVHLFTKETTNLILSLFMHCNDTVYCAWQWAQIYCSALNLLRVLSSCFDLPFNQAENIILQQL